MGCITRDYHLMLDRMERLEKECDIYNTCSCSRFSPLEEKYEEITRLKEKYGIHGGEGSRTPVLRRHCDNVYMFVLPLMLIVAPRAGKRASLRLCRLKSRSTAAAEP